MADQDIPIHDIALGTLEEGSLFAMAFPTSGSNFASGKISAAGLGEGICKDMTFNSLLTYDKSVIGAINELNTVSSQTGYTLTGTLTAGSTTITFTDAVIKADSIVDDFTNIFGVDPIDKVVTEGSCVLTYEAQPFDVGVRIIVRGVSGGGGGYTKTTVLTDGVISANASYQRATFSDISDLDVIVLSITWGADEHPECFALPVSQILNASGGVLEINPYSSIRCNITTTYIEATYYSGSWSTITCSIYGFGEV